MTFEYDPGLIKEQTAAQDGKFLMKGVLQKANTLNQNGRVYPIGVLAREVQNYQRFIEEGRALGELDHPDSSVVELKNVSHIIRAAHMDGDVCYGTLEVLDTPNGRILKSLVESGVKIGISSRGVGSTKSEGGHQIVQDDFQLICWDIVSEPSTPGAFVMKEARDLTPTEIQQVKEYFGKSDKVYRLINKITSWDE
jgi:hypothetical protein|tara:strand:- start:169 stop:756 length:588 start_codon:yes stop_codon:yes gene_type:complete